MSKRGGPRPNSGRKPGSRNKKTIEQIKLVRDENRQKESPLEYMLRVMRDARVTTARRDEMAKAAAPYVHAKLAAIQHSGEGGGPIRTEDTGLQALIGMLEQVARLRAGGTDIEGELVEHSPSEADNTGG